MTMNVIDSERMILVSRELTGYAHYDTAAVTELVRNELWARGTTSRRGMCDRIVSLMQPLSDLKKDDVQAVLDDMERIGDVTYGPRGTLAASPLRVVVAGNGRFRLFGTLPSRLVQRISPSGAARELTDNSDETVSSLIDMYGGVQLSAERWAGFDRFQPAGPDWLKHLDLRLSDEACEPGAFESELSSVWMACRPTNNQSPWKKPIGDDNAKLWRAWTKFGRPLHVWTSGGNPIVSSAMQLTSDEANRTTFAVCMQKGFPVVFNAEAMGTDVILRFDSFLPVAEYRYLTVVGEIQELAGAKKAFRIPLEDWQKVGATLRDRLGVTITSTGM